VAESPLRKNIAQTILILLALVLLGKAVLLFREVNHVGIADNAAQGVYVNGHADAYLKPDTLLFNLSVNEEAKTVAEATQKSAEKMNKAIAVLKANGVDEAQIKTTYYNVSDKYENINTPCAVVAPSSKMMSTQVVEPCSNVSSRIIGSIVSQSLEVRVKDLDKRDKIVADLAATAVKIDGVSFTIFDMDAAKEDVRKEAIKNAKEAAKKLESQLGVDFGQVIGFSENTGGYNPYMSARAEGMAVDKMPDNMAPSPTLPVGEQKVSVDVTLTYLIK
jgi:uncharacterized protein YggE